MEAKDIDVSPRSMTVARQLASRLLSLNLLVMFSRQPTLIFTILETITTKFTWSWHFQIVVCLFCAGDIKNFVQILILFNKNNFVEIFRKFVISQVILKAQK